MKFYKNLYIGDTVSKPGKIKRKLKKHAKLTNVYVIVFAKRDRRLEIYHSLMLQQWYYKENPLYIIGIAGNKEEAFGLIQKMAQEALEAAGQADIIAYLALEDPASYEGR